MSFIFPELLIFRSTESPLLSLKTVVASFVHRIEQKSNLFILPEKMTNIKPPCTAPKLVVTPGKMDEKAPYFFFIGSIGARSKFWGVVRIGG